MDQRISFITLAVRDLERTHAFYVDGLGWTPELYVPGEVLMIRTGEHLILSLWAEAGFEAEVGPVRRGDGLPGRDQPEADQRSGAPRAPRDRAQQQATQELARVAGRERERHEQCHAGGHAHVAERACQHGHRPEHRSLRRADHGGGWGMTGRLADT